MHLRETVQFAAHDKESGYAMVEQVFRMRRPD